MEVVQNHLFPPYEHFTEILFSLETISKANCLSSNESDSTRIWQILKLILCSLTENTWERQKALQATVATNVCTCPNSLLSLVFLVLHKKMCQRFLFFSLHKQVEKSLSNQESRLAKHVKVHLISDNHNRNHLHVTFHTVWRAQRHQGSGLQASFFS